MSTLWAAFAGTLAAVAITATAAALVAMARRRQRPLRDLRQVARSYRGRPPWGLWNRFPDL